MKIGDLFASDIRREIEEITKVDQTQKEVIQGEIGEYVATNSIKSYFTRILDRYLETPHLA